MKSPLHFENNVEKRQKKCLGRYVSRGCDWLVMKKVEKKRHSVHGSSVCTLM